MKITHAFGQASTGELHDEDCMPADYSVRFGEDGVSESIRKNVAQALVEKYDHLVVVDEESDGDSGGSSESDTDTDGDEPDRGEDGQFTSSEDDDSDSDE